MDLPGFLNGAEGHFFAGRAFDPVAVDPFPEDTAQLFAYLQLCFSFCVPAAPSGSRVGFLFSIIDITADILRICSVCRL